MRNVNNLNDPARKTVLIVDDEEPIRKLLRAVLASSNYGVIEAEDGLQALSLAAETRGPIDLVVTDIRMPRLDGFTLVERLVASRSETKVLYISGFADQADISNRTDPVKAGFLRKPFSISGLLETVRQLLAVA